MLVFFENGQLGNQLFQYCALKGLRDKGPLFVVGMDSLKATFTGLEFSAEGWRGRLTERIVSRIGRDRLKRLARKMRLVGLIEESRTSVGTDIAIAEGFLKRVYFCDQAYFQSEKLIDEGVVARLNIRTTLHSRADAIFSMLPSWRSVTCFVHVRRGDYLQWPTLEAPAVLPAHWYLEQMAAMRQRYGRPFFVVVSDDRPYAEDIFGHREDVYISREDEGGDFALMSMCEAGVLSASSFSWWAAHFARRRDNNAFFVAPLYWGGHRARHWHPSGIETSWLNYAEVT